MYTKIRVFGVVGALVWIGVGSIVSLMPLSLQGFPIAVLLGMTLAGVSLSFFMGIKTVRQFWAMAHKLQHQTYDWYRQQHPSHVHPRGVRCHNCGNDRIHVRALMGKLYHREHFCTQCGKTLYYSPEANG